MTVEKFTKGQKLTVRVTFEIEMELKDNCWDYDLFGYAMCAAEDGLNDTNTVTVDILAVDGVSRETKSAEEEDEEEDSNWQEEEQIEEAKAVWEEIRYGSKRDAKTAEDRPVYPDLTENQIQFIRDALDYGLEVVAYSGRGMYGQKCPSVMVDRAQDLRGKSRCEQDSMGLGVVLYAKN